VTDIISTGDLTQTAIVRLAASAEKGQSIPWVCHLRSGGNVPGGLPEPEEFAALSDAEFAPGSKPGNLFWVTGC